MPFASRLGVETFLAVTDGPSRAGVPRFIRRQFPAVLDKTGEALLMGWPNAV